MNYFGINTHRRIARAVPVTCARSMSLASSIIVTPGLSILIWSLCAFLAAINSLTARVAVTFRQWRYSAAQIRAITTLILPITLQISASEHNETIEDSGGIAPLTLTLSTKFVPVATFTSRPLNHLRNTPVPRAVVELMFIGPCIILIVE